MDPEETDETDWQLHDTDTGFCSIYYEHGKLRIQKKTQGTWAL